MTIIFLLMNVIKLKLFQNKAVGLQNTFARQFLKFNFEIDKTDSMLVKDFEKKYLNEYEKTFSKDS